MSDLTAATIEAGDMPHSRACRFVRHDHGSDCHTNCPTCGGNAAFSHRVGGKSGGTGLTATERRELRGWFDSTERGRSSAVIAIVERILAARLAAPRDQTEADDV